MYLAEVAKIRDELFVHNLITCSKNFEQVEFLKDIAIKIFHGAGLKLR